MPDVRIPDIKYPGLEGNLDAFNYTHTQGILPSKIMIRVLGASANQLAAIGDCVISDSVNTVVLPACRVVSGYCTVDGSGISTTVMLEDRRWSWRYSTIDGHYNILAVKPFRIDKVQVIGVGVAQNPVLDARLDNLPALEEDLFPNQVRPQLQWWTKKSARQLAVLLAQAMGEKNYDVANIPDDQYPEVHWQAANAAQQLEMLASQYACVVVWDWSSNRLFIAKRGTGAELPRALPGEIESDTLGEDPPEPPRKITVYGAELTYGVRLQTYPVGVDLDGVIKPIDYLSYRPTGGWWTKGRGGFDKSMFADLNLPAGYTKYDCERLANQYIYKMYKIWYTLPRYKYNTFVFPPTNKPVGYGDERLLEAPEFVIPTQWSTRYQSDGFGRTTVQAARAFGRTASGALTWGVTDTFDEIHVKFEVDADRQVFLFHEQLTFEQSKLQLQLLQEEPGFEEACGEIPAILDGRTVLTVPTCPVIECACMIRDPNKNHVQRFQLSVSPEPGDRPRPDGSGSRANELSILRQEVYYFAHTKYDRFHKVLDTETNYQEAKAKATYHINAKLAEFQTIKPSNRIYNGIKPASCDGAIQEVTWLIQGNGATTIISRNNEYGVWIDPLATRKQAVQANDENSLRAQQNMAKQNAAVAALVGSGANGIPFPIVQ